MFAPALSGFFFSSHCALLTGSGKHRASASVVKKTEFLYCIYYVLQATLACLSRDSWEFWRRMSFCFSNVGQRYAAWFSKKAGKRIKLSSKIGKTLHARRLCGYVSALTLAECSCEIVSRTAKTKYNEQLQFGCNCNWLWNPRRKKQWPPLRDTQNNKDQPASKPLVT